MKYSYVYILTNDYNTTLYIGVTSNLIKRIYEHKNKLVLGFTERYNLHKLIYFETYEDMEEAIRREKTLKGGSRKKKFELIVRTNPTFKDLYPEII